MSERIKHDIEQLRQSIQPDKVGRTRCRSDLVGPALPLLAALNQSLAQCSAHFDPHSLLTVADLKVNWGALESKKPRKGREKKPNTHV